MPAIRVLQLVPTRRTLISYQRDLLVQRFAEIEALRQDLKRLKRLSTQVAPCWQCRVRATITICEDGAFRCARCQAAPKEEAV